jgi:hypothetical protein
LDSAHHSTVVRNCRFKSAVEMDYYYYYYYYYYYFIKSFPLRTKSCDRLTRAFCSRKMEYWNVVLY